VYCLPRKKNQINVNEQLNSILQVISQTEIEQNINPNLIIKQLKHARKHLTNCRLKLYELREEYLDILQEQLIQEGRLTKAEAVRQLSNKER
jgi:hypothetical protein